MKKEDLELLLIAGRHIGITTGDEDDSIESDKCLLQMRQYTLKEILDYGWTKYWGHIGLFLFDFEEFLEGLSPDENADEETKASFLSQHHYLQSLSKEDYLLVSASQDKEFCEKIIEALNLLSQGVDWRYQLVEGNYMVYFNHTGSPVILDSNLLEQIISLIEIMHCMKKPDDVVSKEGMSDKLKELLKKKKEVERRLKKAKTQDSDKDDSGEGVGFSDLISIVSAKANGISIFSVWELTYYQLYNQFLRLQKMETFNLEFQSSIAAMKASNNLVHWMGRL